MAANTSFVTKPLYYKRALLIGEASGATTLQDYLDAALSAVNLPMDRKEITGVSADNVRMINKCSRFGTLICGRFLDFTEGGSQAVLELDPAAEELKIRHMLPGDAERYLEGILTFGVRDNHVVLVQSKGLRVAHLEQHLNWLLGSLTSVLPPGVKVILEDQPKQEIRSKLEDVDWIELRAPVPVSIFTDPPERIPKGFIGGILSHLRATVPSSSTFFEELSGDAALAVDQVELTMRIKRGRRSKYRRPMLDEIAHNLRNVDDVDFVLKTKNGVYHAGELKLTTARPLPLDAGSTGMPELQSTAIVMQAWLADLITQRRIQA
jgi:hypothetical protein